MVTHPFTTLVSVLLVAASTAAQQLSPQEIARRAIPAVVTIRGLTHDGKEVSGSGFIVDPSGTIVTNLHVIEGLKTAAVKLHHPNPRFWRPGAS